MAATKEQFAALLNRPLREKTILVEGLEVKLREMTELENAKYEASRWDENGEFIRTNARRNMIALMAIDDEGKPLVEDAASLKTMPRSIAAVIYSECLKLNEYEPEEQADLVKKSDGADA